MSTSFDYLWDGSRPQGSARVVWHTSSRLVISATDQTTKSGVLRFKKRARGLESIPLHEVWGAIQADGLVMPDLENRFAWEITRLAEQSGLKVGRTVRNLGGVTFFDHEGRVVDVPAEESLDLLQTMKDAGCLVDEVSVD